MKHVSHRLSASNPEINNTLTLTCKIFIEAFDCSWEKKNHNNLSSVKAVWQILFKREYEIQRKKDILVQNI